MPLNTANQCAAFRPGNLACTNHLSFWIHSLPGRRNHIVYAIRHGFLGDFIEHLPPPRFALFPILKQIPQMDAPVSTNFMKWNPALFEKLNEILTGNSHHVRRVLRGQLLA